LQQLKLCLLQRVKISKVEVFAEYGGMKTEEAISYCSKYQTGVSIQNFS
jgi:hypothetical protein